MPQPLRINAPSPVGGVNTVVAREGQPPGTCWNALNVLPYDVFGRKRVAQRPGLTKTFSSTTPLGVGKIQGLLPVNNIIYGGSSASTVITPLNGWTIPSFVTTSTNNLFFSGSYTPGPSDTTPQYNGTIPETGWVLSFNVKYTATTTNPINISINIDPSSTTTFSGGIDRLSAFYQFTPSTAASNLFIFSSTTSDFIETTDAINAPPGSTIPCSISWTSGGTVSATVGVWPTNGGGGGGGMGTFNVPISSGPDFISIYANGEDASETVTISDIILTQTVGVPSGQAGYQTLLIAVCDGYVWVGNNGVVTKAANGQPTPQISSTAFVSMAYADGQVFIVDGSSTLWNYTVASDTVAATIPVPSPGNITGVVPTNCNLICNWRGRITLAGDSLNPQNFYMARPSGSYFNTGTSTLTVIGPGVDWDYSQEDSAAAVAGNLAHSGKIGEPITALIPFSDDYLKFGCSHSLWMAQGDPADGGTITNVSNTLGIVGKDAWCIDPAGTLWFVATGGVFQVRPAWEFYRPPEPISQRQINQSFTGLNPSTTKVSLVYDPDLLYLHIFVTPVDGITPGTHMNVDMRSIGEGEAGFWPQQYMPVAGPTSSVLYFADGNPNNRAIVLGGWDGFIRSLSDTVYDDDGSTISATVTLGPFAPVPGEAAVLTGVTIDLGELPPVLSSTNWNVQAKIAAGPDAYSVTEGLNDNANPHPIATVVMPLDRRQKVFRQRLRGGWFSLTLSNFTDDAFFSIESAMLEFVPGGRNRELR